MGERCVGGENENYAAGEDWGRGTVWKSQARLRRLKEVDMFGSQARMCKK